ncbi:MAG: sulfatase-like hydrolase/transferase [Acidobacteria bacterium]|nr:sulfatase-like hydrolase/transferase [Acidobacteriota bacterium]
MVFRSGSTRAVLRRASHQLEGRGMPAATAGLLLVFALISLACFSSPAETSLEQEPLDIILVTIDTLRADTLGYAGHPRVSTPFLDRIASEGIVFTNAHAHNVVTLPSHANILTGRLPYEHGVRDNAGFKLSSEHNTLASILRDAGYINGAFVGAYPLDARFGLDRGFDLYDDRYREGSAPTQFVMAERPADEVIAAARQWYQSAGEQKKFMWVHLYDPHAPYKAPAEFAAKYPGEPYLAEIEWTDFQLASLLKPILESGRPTLLVITSDHGEGLGEHGELTHGVFAYESTLAVPLLVHESGRIAPRVEDGYVRHIDIAPTILERAGLAVPGDLRGVSLLDVSEPRDTYFESLTASFNRGWAPLVGVIHDSQKYIDLPVPELYDLESDPSEQRNVATLERRTLFRLRDILSDAAPLKNMEREEVSQEEAANLLSLGYVSGNAAKKNYTEADDPKNLIHLDQKAQEIIARYQEGAIDEAVSIAESILEERPDMVLVREMLSFLLQQAERPEAAIAALRQGLAASPHDDAMKKRLGLVLSESGRAAEAVAVLSQFEHSDDPELLNSYGIALADSGNPGRAIQQFERVLEFDATNATAYQNLGIVALRAGDLQRSHRYLMKALSLNDQMPIALNTLGVVFARTGNVSGAIEAWQKAVSIDPGQYDALFNLSLTAGRAGHLEIARESLETFIRTAPPERYASDIAVARRLLAELNGEAS